MFRVGRARLLQNPHMEPSRRGHDRQPLIRFRWSKAEVVKSADLNDRGFNTFQSIKHKSLVFHSSAEHFYNHTAKLGSKHSLKESFFTRSPKIPKCTKKNTSDPFVLCLLTTKHFFFPSSVDNFRATDDRKQISDESLSLVIVLHWSINLHSMN